MISLDTETTGLDLRHGAKPYLVTICDEEGENTYWEWDVDPLTREPNVPPGDLEEIQAEIDAADLVVLQNPKFDVRALQTVFNGHLRWDWGKTRDTLLAGHLLASNEPHDLTTMTLVYLGYNSQPFEDRIKKATEEARRIVRRDFPDWRIAKKGLEEMPSAKEKVWKFDMWLPQTLVREQRCSVANLSSSDEDYDVRIDRKSKWGNPFRIGEDGTRKQVIEKYRKWILKQEELIDSLGELQNKVLGCHCYPKACHGDVLAEMANTLEHPWENLCADYANSDSTTTIALYKEMRKLLKRRKLWKIYKERLKVLPVVYKMEDHGITANRNRLQELRTTYQEESAKAAKTCLGIAKKYKHELALPKSGVNKSLHEFIFNCLKLDPVKRSTKTGKASLDNECMNHYVDNLPEDSEDLEFILALRNKRKRDTALNYMEGYEKFWLPTGFKRKHKEDQAWFRLYPSLNPTGTDTLRWSSSNPNEQNISKKEGFNLRYCFGPSPGREWWALDYDNLELRIPAFESKEREMIDLFERPDEAPFFGSYHLLVCSILHPQKWEECLAEGIGFKKKHPTLYGRTKNGNFANQYGAVLKDDGWGTADRAYGVRGGQAKVQKRLSKIAKLNQKIIAFADKNGYVETIPDKEVDPKRGYPLLCGRSRWGKVRPTLPLNYHVQGTACWIMNRAMVKVQDYLDTLGEEYKMIMNVHDEIVLDFPKKKKRGNLPKVRRIRRIMESIGNCVSVPLTCGIDYHENNWSEGISV